MRYLDFVLICAVFAGCQGNPAAVSMTADTPVGLFSIIEPLADADPSIRHAVEVNVPTIMRVVSRGNSVTVSFPTLVPMNFLHGGLVFEPGDIVLTLGRDGVPEPGQEFILEQQVTMFETDIPTQHMWSPKVGKYYRVLWTQTFRQTIK